MDAYGEDYIDACRKKIASQVSAYERLASEAGELSAAQGVLRRARQQVRGGVSSIARGPELGWG